MKLFYVEYETGRIAGPSFVVAKDLMDAAEAVKNYPARRIQYYGLVSLSVAVQTQIAHDVRSNA